MVGEIFLGTNDACDTSESMNDSSESSESSKASASVGRHSSFFELILNYTRTLLVADSTSVCVILKTFTH